MCTEVKRIKNPLKQNLFVTLWIAHLFPPTLVVLTGAGEEGGAALIKSYVSLHCSFQKVTQLNSDNEMHDKS